MRLRTAKSQTADLFAGSSASPAVQRPALIPAVSSPATAQPSGRVRTHQLWYAAVFPKLCNDEKAAGVLQRLCLHAQAFTSFVSTELPDALLLEIKGSLKLFGSPERLHADIDAGWRRLALEVSSATAPSTLAALWFARGAAHTGNAPGSPPTVIEDLRTLPGHLAELPIACTAWDGERLQTLRAMGVTRMGDLLRLPRAGLARRLGADMVRDLDIALGRQFAPRRAFVPRARFRARCDFETEIENVAYLEKALEPLIARCAQFLRERQAGIQALRLKLRHRTEPATGVHLGLASITGERRRLMGVLTQKLNGLELKAPVRGMELISGSLLPLSAASLDVFAGLAGAGTGTGAGCGRDTAPQLVERLRARLGEEAVYGVASIPEHRPEAAWRRIHELSLATALRMGEKITGSGLGEGMPRPVWLMDAPLLLADELILEQGPERIESGWWDGRGVARDYYIARRTPRAHRPQGAKLWVFQERQSKRWYLHGVFA
jgi:protein ImuB